MRSTVVLSAALLLAGCSMPGQRPTPAEPAAPGSVAPTTPGPATPTAAPPAATSTPGAPSPSSGASSAPVPPPQGSATPADPYAGAVLETGGFGPIKVGMSVNDAVKAGYLVPSTTGCGAYETSRALRRMGVEVQPSENRVAEISLILPESGKVVAATRSGAKVGMTFTEVRRIYGGQLQTETKNGNGGPFQAGVVRAGARELAFVPDYPGSWQVPLTDSMKVRSIVARDYSKDLFGGC